MSLPYSGMDFVPFDILTAAELDQMVANDQALADGSGLNDGSISTAKIADANVTTNKLTDSSITSAKLAPTKAPEDNGWTVYDYGTWKEYVKQFGPYTTTSTASLAGATLATSQALPAGVAPNTVFMMLSWVSNTSGTANQYVAAVFNYDPASSTIPSTFSLGVRNITSSSVAFAGVYVTVRLRTV